MTFWKSRNARAQRGQSMVEFALVLPVVLLLIFGLLEFGRIISAELSASHCANELARYGVIPGRTPEDIRNHAYDTPVCPTFNLEDTPGAELIIQVDVAYPTGGTSGKAVVVTIAYPIDLVVPVIKQIFAAAGMDPYPAKGRATLQME